MLFTTPDLGNYISGAILYEETLFQNHANGTPFVDCLNKIGVIPGIKVDTGLSPLPGGHEVETWCSGLDGLVERAKKYYAQGARFAKWRAVLQITADGAPSDLSIQVSLQEDLFAALGLTYRWTWYFVYLWHVCSVVCGVLLYLQSSGFCCVP